jgi:nucleotide-binding universal stress UspA family protein
MTEARVLVTCEATARGRAALRHAADLSRAQQAELVVLAVAPQASVDSGCLRCRGSAAIWNRAMVEVAEEELEEARALLGVDEPAGTRYLVRRGDHAAVIAAAAAELGAGCVIVPHEPERRVPLPRRRSLAARLGAAGAFRVVCAPPAPAERR